jgi:hypothetical protein
MPIFSKLFMYNCQMFILSTLAHATTLKVILCHSLRLIKISLYDLQERRFKEDILSINSSYSVC